MSTPKVYSAICAVMADIGKTGIAKERKNAQQGYNFRGIDDVYNELNGLLAKHNLVLLPSVVSSERDERETQKGGVLFYTRLTVDFKVVSAEDGSSDTIRTVGEAMDSGDKSSNKAQSAAYKYAAMMVFCIPTEGDNDADYTTHEVTPRRSSASLKREEDPRGDKLWTQLRTEMGECQSTVRLRALYTQWKAKAAKDGWPRAWVDALESDFKHEAEKMKEREAHIINSNDDTFPGDMPSPNYLLAG